MIRKRLPMVKAKDTPKGVFFFPLIYSKLYLDALQRRSGLQRKLPREL